MVEDRVGYLLKRAQHALRLATDAALRPLALTTPQYAALSAVETEPGASSAALARRAFVTPQTMNEVVRSLVGSGLLTRQAHPAHGRVIQLYLTPHGTALLTQAHTYVAVVEAQLLAGLAAPAQAQLAAWLRTCSEALERLPSAEDAAPAPNQRR
ncbi:MAG: MarR family winged helix-turn-helix transcriptional regulator [Chloroflexales bacterium]